jgi:Flp pilus assembly protein TadB
MVSQKKAIGILGIAFAVAGGIAWFFGQHIPAAMLWGVAVLIVLKLNKRQQQKQKRR